MPRTKTDIMCACRDPQADVAAFQEQGGNILVGTPGRLSDIFERSQVLDARKLEVLVLDEADRLLDAGYGKHLENLMRRLPKQRRTGAPCLRVVPSVFISLHSDEDGADGFASSNGSMDTMYGLKQRRTGALCHMSHCIAVE